MADKLDLVELSSTFGDMPPDEVAKVLDGIGAKAAVDYEATTKELLELLEKNDPIAILAVMGWRFFASQGVESSDQRWPAAEQHHLELLQALALRGRPPAAPEPGRLADKIQRVAELLDLNTRAFSLRRVKAPEADAEEKTKHQASLLDQIRSSTQFVRGEFLPHQLDRYLGAILGRIDVDFSAVHGIPATALSEIFQKLLSLIEKKLNDHRRRGRKVVKSYKAKKAVKAYLEAFPDELARRDFIISDATRKGVKPHQMRLFLVEEMDRFLPQVYSFDETDIASVCPPSVDIGAAKKAIEAWSFAFGDLAERPLDHLYLANPVWDQPLIKLANGRYFWPSPGSSLSFGFEMFERLIATDAGLVKKYEDARSQVLEEELGLLLRKYFHSGRVLEKVTWTNASDGKDYENDVVVLSGRTALIFEAKSGKVSAEAKRGADRRLKREITKLMVEPAVQSKRLMDLLCNDRRAHVFQTKEGPQTIDSRNIDQVIRVNITFNIIGALSSRWPDLADAEFIEQGAVEVPTMSIADLDIICELLKEQTTITHYLQRRTEFEANANYYADEYDLVAFYLKTGFNVGETEFDGTKLMIYGLSSELNSYYKRQAEGQRPPQPKVQRTKLFSRIISTLEEQRPEHWVESATRLLNVGIVDQETLERHFGASAERVRRSREANMSWCAQVGNGPPQRRQAIAFVLVPLRRSI